MSVVLIPTDCSVAAAIRRLVRRASSEQAKGRDASGLLEVVRAARRLAVDGELVDAARLLSDVEWPDEA